MNDNNDREVFVKKTVVENNSDENTRPENQGVSQSSNSSVYEKTVVAKSGQGNLKARKIVYYLLGIVEILLACRFILRLLGANPVNTFVKIIYSITNALLCRFPEFSDRP